MKPFDGSEAVRKNVADLIGLDKSISSATVRSLLAHNLNADFADYLIVIWKRTKWDKRHTCLSDFLRIFPMRVYCGLDFFTEASVAATFPELRIHEKNMLKQLMYFCVFAVLAAAAAFVTYYLEVVSPKGEWTDPLVNICVFLTTGMFCGAVIKIFVLMQGWYRHRWRIAGLTWKGLEARASELDALPSVKDVSSDDAAATS